jgi:hypothetical protein
MTSGRKGDTVCGTVSGCTLHYKRGEKPCGPCRTAKTAYERARRQPKVEEARVEREAARAQRQIEREESKRAKSAACRRGHPWTPESTGRQRYGYRLCLICKRERAHERHARNYAENREQFLAWTAEWDATHPNGKRDKDQRWRKRHPERARARGTSWRERNIEHRRQWATQYYAEHPPRPRTEEDRERDRLRYLSGERSARQRAWRAAHPPSDDERAAARERDRLRREADPVRYRAKHREYYERRRLLDAS